MISGCCRIETDDVVDKGDVMDDGDNVMEDDAVVAVVAVLVDVDDGSEDMDVTRTGVR
jgi:hypothetical protein